MVPAPTTTTTKTHHDVGGAEKEKETKKIFACKILQGKEGA
jgi:hypothetical protein